MSEIPRRCRIDLMSPAELAIREAMGAVEDMAADVRLTDAVILLGAAKDSVADYIDNIGPVRRLVRFESDAPERETRPDDIGLSIDMLDVDRLREWARLLLVHGADISHWGSVPFVAGKMQIMATEMETVIRDIGTLRERVRNYLENGGLFNPEAMDHAKVRELVMDLALASPRASAATEQPEGISHDWRWDNVLNGYRCNACLVRGSAAHGPTCPKGAALSSPSPAHAKEHAE